MEFKIQNMVGSCDVKFPIRLEGLVVKHSQFSRSVVLGHLATPIPKSVASILISCDDYKYKFDFGNVCGIRESTLKDS